MFLSSLSIKRPILVSMFLSVFLLFGTLSYFSLTLNLVPELDIAWVTVQTIYPGAGPEEIETQITEKIEDAIATVSGINAMNSFSMESVSFTIIEFEIGKNPGEATQEVKDKINTILNTFPDDAELPIVDRFDINAQPIMDIILTGNISGRELFELAENKLKDRFAQVAGVARVNVTGGVEREIRIELDNRAVYQYGISLVQLNQILSAWNLDMPGGHFKFGEMEYSVRMDGEFDQVEDLLSLEIPTAGGLKTLNSVATITDGGAEVRKRTSYFNVKENLKQDNVVLMSIIKSSDGNTVELVKDVKKILPEMEAELPPGSELKVVSDNSVFIKSSVEDTLMNIVLGIILTALVLLFFLHDIRSTLIVSLSMPMSIMSTFLLMQMSGFSLNMMSLMGLSTSVGILVTNSVVVLENIFRHKELGHNRKEAADIGTAEIVVAVVASALTNVAVFLPIATMSGVVGQFFKEFALTVTFATAFSLLMSFTLTPMMASIILPQGKGRKNPIGERLEKMFHSWETGYKNLLQFLIKSRFRSAMVVLTAVLMFFGSFFIAARVGFEFMPFMDQGD
ncbi:MAG: efflux RND transporter permease subunit, partial [FCB group bacterium]|nr:efflux RND transporter permease subunit [FCB group bacterium]